jgi:hypothetical protein
MRYVRIAAEYPQDKDEYPLSFDFFLDDAMKPTGNFYSHGLSGRPEQDGKCFPFVLLEDGTIDFGVSFEDEQDRYWKTNARETKIEQGATFKVTVGEQEYEYQIVNLADLLK